MGSVMTGWWSWLVAIWTGLLLVLSVLFLFEEGEGSPRTFAGRAGLSLIFLGIAAVAGTGLIVRLKAPRLAAWLLVVGVGLPGAGFFWALFIPTAIALFILVSGVKTGEISFRQPELANAAQD